MEPTLTTLHATQGLGLDPRTVEQVDANTIRLTFTHDQLDRLAHAEILTFDHDDCYSDDDVIEARAQGRRSVLAELKKLTGLTAAQLEALGGAA